MKPDLNLLIATVSLAAVSLACADEASHRQAAMDLLEAAEMEAVFTKTIDQVLAEQVAENPSLGELKPVMKAFFDKHMSWAALKTEMAQIYAEQFTEDELKDITRFYQTPSGKKMARITPDLMAKGAMLGQEKVQAHLGELGEMIEAYKSTKAAP